MAKLEEPFQFYTPRLTCGEVEEACLKGETGDFDDGDNVATCDFTQYIYKHCKGTTTYWWQTSLQLFHLWGLLALIENRTLRGQFSGSLLCQHTIRASWWLRVDKVLCLHRPAPPSGMGQTFKADCSPVHWRNKICRTVYVYV